MKLLPVSGMRSSNHAYDVDEGFMELNWPPEPEKGYASQVINCFSWSSGGSSWTKITLPRNAEVERLCFVGEKCLLQIQDKERTQTLRFEGFPNEIIRLSVATMSGHPYLDERLWKALREAEDKMAR